MWTVLKFDKKNLYLLKQDLYKKLGKDTKIYIPKLRVQKYKNNKLINKEYNLLGDYLFCYHKSLGYKNIIDSLRYTRVLSKLKMILLILSKSVKILKVKKGFYL